MSQQISFTIPLTSSAIGATIIALSAMKNDLSEIPSVGVQTQLHIVDVPIVTPDPIAAIPEVPLAPTLEEAEALDSAGQLWNAKLHASTKTFVQDGTWKKKKGVTPTPPVAETPPMTEGKSVTPISENTVSPKAVATPGVSPFRQLLVDITSAGLSPDYVQTTCLEVNGRSLSDCKADSPALEMLRMGLGL